ncbi:CHRD domain-containing protein [Sediminibacterium sp.]|uniref:CHRD domain-containing protein n=1 Tax=Sediminibacterium sp. TaxID=1917865 RepID=UPI003F71E0DB
MKNFKLFVSIIAATALFASCKKNDSAPEAQLVKEIMVSLAAANENPQPTGRTERGMATIKVYNDNSIMVEGSITGFASTDNLTLAHIHAGDPVTNGPVVLDLMPSFTGSSLKATVKGIRTSLIDSLKAGTAELYLNIHSSQVASGIVRGQLFNEVNFAASIALSGANEVPSVTTTATGMALIRITADNKLYSRVTVSNLESTDALSAAHIHTGAAGTNGGVILGLCSSAADFGVTKIFSPTTAVLNSVKNDAVYVNVHSTMRPSGVIRGQIR